MHLVLSQIFLIMSVLVSIGADVCPCNLLVPLYTTLECKSICRRGKCLTKFDCSKSRYMMSKSQQQCYYEGRFYVENEYLPGRYPNEANTHLCKHACKLSSLGPFFLVTNDCILGTYVPPTGTCPLAIINSVDDVYMNSVPLFSGNDTCPTRWIQYESVDYQFNITEAKGMYCRYGDLLIKRNTGIFIKSSNVNCTCDCPPIPTCRTN
ncbi:hypothetical protein FQR65_LT02075 [Abscondita terminalis]|nr:hypothetical protein FQR65_LT02075 [Abscondita terminalis]